MAAVPSIGRAAKVASATDATERLYDSHHRKIYAFCLYQLGNREDAAEASQTTFMQALTALRRGVDPAFELPWLIAIARNVCRTRWDAGKRRRRLELARDPHDLASIAPARETTELVGIDDALAALPEPQRRALVLREWQGLSYQEIADELGVSLSAAETLIFRGRRALARELGADEEGKRSFGIGSLLGSVKSAAGGGLTVKVAVGVVAAVGIGVAAHHELVLPTPVRGQAPAAAGPSQPAAVGLPGTRAVPATRLRARKAPVAARPLEHTKSKATVARSGAHRPAQTPAGPAASVPAATATPTTSAEPPSSALPPQPGRDVPSAQPASGAARPAPAATPAVATPPPPVVAAPPPVTDAVQPVATAAGDVGGTVTGAVDPVVTTATDTVGQVVTTVTDATAPVVTTVTNVLPTPVVPVQVPPVTVPPVHLP